MAAPASGQPSSRDLAELQGISPSFVAKIFPKLEKTGIYNVAENDGSVLTEKASQILGWDAGWRS